VIPKHLRKQLGQRLFHVSLQSGIHSEAKKLALELNSRVKEIYRLFHLTPLSIDEIKNSLKQNLACLKNPEQNLNPNLTAEIEQPELSVQQFQLGNSLILLSTVIDEYLSERKASDSLNSKTITEYRKGLSLLLDILGDIDCNTIGYEQSRFAKKVLQQFPSNRKKKKAYKDKTVQEIIDLDIPKEDLLSTTSVNNDLRRFGTFFLWAKQHGYVAENYFEGLKIAQKVKPNENKLPFTPEQVQQIFDPIALEAS